MNSLTISKTSGRSYFSPTTSVTLIYFEHVVCASHGTTDSVVITDPYDLPDNE